MGVRKKVDERLRTLLSNCVKTQHRSLVVIVGDNGKDQVVNLHYMLSKLQVKARPSVLWCYKKELGFSSYKKKRMRQIKKMVQRGLYDAERDDPFELFVSSTQIRWAFYNETDKILGQTFGMCVLQDFEALTPNLLARTIETVEGGGCVVVLLKKLDSLKQLYTMTMDVHDRFRTESHGQVKPRFNERWLLSLASCETCAVVDDELNILPISKHIRDIKPLETVDEESAEAVEDWNTAKAAQNKLAQLKSSLAGTQPAQALVGLAKTVDQATAVLAFLNVVADKSLASTVTLTAGRGRGKSAALGIAIASAVAFGYSNIFVTSPSPENLKTVFEFLLKAFDALEYKEHLDYEVVQSTNPDFNKAVVRVSVFHQHRQTIQYIDPQDHAALAQAELVVIDEAAAIPLPLVRNLIGPYLVFLSSTIHGYEGTGRSLSLKLISQLRQSANRSSKAATEGGWRTNEHMFKPKVREQMDKDASKGKGASSSDVIQSNLGNAAGSSKPARALHEIILQQPIRYADGDRVEAWLNRTLCLDATDSKQTLSNGTPPPSATQLFAVDRDVLMSHHSVSEAMLQRIVSLFVASHYKNSPNDLLLLSDAPAHRLFVLMGPEPEDADGLPDVLCAVQVALEGGIARGLAATQLQQGNRASGDLVPWTVAQQFQDPDFAHLDGARVVRIATNASAMGMGYGRRALELLTQFYQGDLINADLVGEPSEQDAFENLGSSSSADLADGKGLLDEKIKPRKNLPPLLVPLSELRPPRLHYLSVSYGMTKELFNFWAGSGFRPIYLRQTANDLTGEYTCIMLKPLATDGMAEGLEEHWEDGFCADFARRFMALLCGPFKRIPATVALTILSTAMRSGSGAGLSQDQVDAGQEAELPADAEKDDGSITLSPSELSLLFLPHDIKRLQAYAKNMVDFHMITDLLNRLAVLFFQRRLPGALTLSQLQRALVVGMGVQFKTVEELSEEYGLPTGQLLALFNKAIRKLSSSLSAMQEAHARAEVESSEVMKSASRTRQALQDGKLNAPLQTSLDAEQRKEGQKALDKLKKTQQELLTSLNLDQYAVTGSDERWEDIEAKVGANATSGAVVSLPREAGATPEAKSPFSHNKGDREKRKKDSQAERFSARSSSKKHKRS